MAPQQRSQLTPTAEEWAWLRDLGQRWQEIRRRQGSSRPDWALQLGITAVRLKNIEQGTYPPSLLETKRIADLVGVPVGQHLGELIIHSPQFHLMFWHWSQLSSEQRDALIDAADEMHG